MEVSICIVSYQTCALLRECLRSIAEHPPRGDYEVIIADNHSLDGTVEMLSEEFSDVQLIRNHENLGYTVPMNQALRLATGKLVVQLNPDTLITEDAFPLLQDFMQANAEVGICTPKIVNRDGSLQLQCRRSEARPWDVLTYFTQLSKMFPHSPFFAGYLMTYRDENECFPVDAVSGSCMLIRREVIEHIGYLDEGFYAFQEDTDYCLRARQAGWRVYYFPKARIVHYGGEGGTKTHLYRSIRIWHASYYRYYRKHFANDYFFLFNWFFYGLMGGKMLFALLRAAVSRDRYVGSKKP